MNSIIKKVVTVVACTSIVGGCAMMSNAALKSTSINCTIGKNSVKKLFSYSDVYNYYTYEYSVSYIHYSGCATGAYLPNMLVKVNSSNYICEVNSSHKKGPCHVDSPKDQNYRLHNNTSKSVSIKMDFILDEYY